VIQNDNRLEANERYIESTSSENVILFYATNNKRLLIECLYSYLEITVTMDDQSIERTLNRSETEFGAKMILKHKIK